MLGFLKQRRNKNCAPHALKIFSDPKLVRVPHLRTIFADQLTCAAPPMFHLYAASVVVCCATIVAQQRTHGDILMLLRDAGGPIQHGATL